MKHSIEGFFRISFSLVKFVKNLIKGVFLFVKPFFLLLYRRYKELAILVLACMCVANPILYAARPALVMPYYKAFNRFVHDSKITTDLDVMTIFADIKATLPTEYRTDLTLYVVDQEEPNAFVDEFGNVTITKGLIEVAKFDKGAVAAVLGHEISHYILNHHRTAPDSSNIMLNQPFLELMADNMGLTLANGAGYNGCNVSDVWEVFDYKIGSNLIPTSHPANILRKINIDKLCRNIP